MSLDPIYRRFHHGNITFSMHVRVPGEFHPRAQPRRSRPRQSARLSTKCRATNGRSSPICGCFYAWMYGHPGKKLLFMGGEFGQWREWNHDTQLDWQLIELPRHDGLRRLVQHLNHVYKSEPALWELDDTYEGFEWIDFHDADNSVVSFLAQIARRRHRRFVVNATPVGALQLPARRSRGRLLSRDHQHRRRDLRRQQRRQPRRRSERRP